MGRKSRHYRDESDPLLGFYSQNLANSSSIRNPSNPLYSSTDIFSSPTKTSDSETEIYRTKAGEKTPLVLGTTDNSHSTLPNNLRDPSQLGYNQTRKDKNVLTASESKRHKKKAKPVKPKKHGYRVHRVSYTAQDHIQVMFRLYGSAFPNVFPFVVINVAWCVLVYVLKRYNILDWTFHSSVGHSFMGLLVSFLIVSRSQISYTRFMDYRRLLASSYRACRLIAQFTTVYTFYTNTPEAREWRQEVCYRTILMLRVTMDALLWSSTERDRWEEEYYQYRPGGSSEFLMQPSMTHSSSTEEDDEDEAANGATFSRNGLGPKHNNHDDDNDDVEQGQLGESDDVSEHFFRFRKLTHGRRSQIDENFRAPITFMHTLRSVIMEHPQYLGYKMAVNEYRDLLDFVSKFDESFHSFRVLVFTPYPFPLVQMTRAFLFFWVYTLPLVLLVDYRLWSSLLIVILVTFGFVGIEYVSMALDDPFADDTNDVDEHGMALLVYEDIYMALYRTDGPQAAMALRERVLQRYKQGRALDCYREDLKGYKIWEPAHVRHEEIGPSPDWSRNPPPRGPKVDGIRSPEEPSATQSTKMRLRRPPTGPPSNVG